MTSQFLIDGDLFVEVVDNDDGGGFSPKRVEELSRTKTAPNSGLNRWEQPRGGRVFASEADTLVEGEPDPKGACSTTSGLPGMRIRSFSGAGAA